MADTFPTALQRTSDERWVTLEVVTHERGRLLARVEEDPRRVAVVRWNHDPRYGLHLHHLLATPPPDVGRGIHLGWPVDLLHDLDANIVGYLAPRPHSRRSFPLGEYVDPVRRATFAPLASRRHHLRVTRHVATVVAALHHAGHGRVRGWQFRVDDRARVLLVRADELAAAVTRSVIEEDERRLGNLALRLLRGHPWASSGDLGALLARAGDTRRAPAPAEEWFHTIRQAERNLPADRVAAPAQAPTRLAKATDLQAARQQPPSTAALPSNAGRRPRPTLEPAQVAAASIVTPAPVGPGPAPPRPGPTTQVAGPSLPAPRRPAGAAGQTVTSPTGEVARAAFTLACGLLVGGVASVGPFATFLAGALLLFGRAAMETGSRRATRGRGQATAIALSRFVPFATGGMALAAFILLDLLLLLGLVMAIAQRVFEYGPGFTLGWVFDLPEIPLLVRWFAFAVGGAVGLSTGGELYDRLRERASGRRMIATPALALAIAVGLAIVDAGVVWWPLPAG